MILSSRISQKWARFWMRFAGTRRFGRVTAYLATWGSSPYYGRIHLSRLSKRGYVSHRAYICHTKLKLGNHIYIDDGVLIFQDQGGETVEIGDSVHIHRDTIVQTGSGGSLTIGDQTHIQPRCQFSAYKGSIVIGRRVEIAPACAFYSYDHGISHGLSVKDQPISTKGGIVLKDDVWLGYGVIVLDGVCIGKDAVIGAGSVVTRDIPENVIAVGNPAKIIKKR
jgi:acetyltransferase-like isoleucine patch superfamily enzyme